LQKKNTKNPLGKPKRKYIKVSNAVRIQVIIATCEFGLECVWAAKLFDISYTNVKAIFLTYKKERKLIPVKQSFSPERVGHDNYLNMDNLRERTIKKIMEAFDGELFPENIAKRLTIRNTSILIPHLNAQVHLENFFATFGGVPGTKGKQTITLPLPRTFDIVVPPKPACTSNLQDIKCIQNER
jgi:hypothetical protein